MRAYRFLLFAFMASSYCFMAQSELSKWYFGNKAALDFATSPPSLPGNSAMYAQGCSSIADAAGNLLFYTDGDTVWDRTHAIMGNGTGLVNNNNGGYQNPLIIKQPGNTNIYYIITFSITGNTSSICYSMVDMNQGGGLGYVTAQNVAFFTGLFRSGLAATRHCNGRDAWLLIQVQPAFNVCNFLAFPITASGIGSPVSSAALPVVNAFSSELVIAPDGKKLALMDNGEPGLAYFDNNTGLVSNQFTLTAFYSCHGFAFSPDATKLYSYRQSPTDLLQWDVCASSSVTIDGSRDSLNLGHVVSDLRLAIDGKIYLAPNYQTSLDVINYPNQPLASCGYSAAAQSIAPHLTSTGGFPNFENGRKHAAPQTPPYTYTVSNSFGCQTASFTAMPVIQNYTTIGCSVIGYSLTSLLWDFGDPNSGAANTSTLVSPGHHFSALGTYTVKLILNYSCGGANDTISEVVQVTQPCISVVTAGILCSSLGHCHFAYRHGALFLHLDPDRTKQPGSHQSQSRFVHRAGAGCHQYDLHSNNYIYLSCSAYGYPGCQQQRALFWRCHRKCQCNDERRLGE